MSLISCKDCGKEISSAASACPSCGAPVASASAGVRKNPRLLGLLGGGAVGLVVGKVMFDGTAPIAKFLVLVLGALLAVVGSLVGRAFSNR